MTVTIPRFELAQIAERYASRRGSLADRYGMVDQYEYGFDFDPGIDELRAVARDLRADADAGWETAEADDLDALADRYEREAGR